MLARLRGVFFDLLLENWIMGYFYFFGGRGIVLFRRSPYFRIFGVLVQALGL
jgi:hypothetical protein